MKMTHRLQVFSLAILFVLPVHAQDAVKSTAKPKMADSPSVALLKQWNEIGRKLIAMAEDFPEDKYDFKAAPTTAPFAVRLIHAAAASYFFTNSALGQKLPGMEDPPRAQFKNKAAIVAYVKKSFADGAAAIQSKGDKGISTLVMTPASSTNPWTSPSLPTETPIRNPGGAMRRIAAAGTSSGPRCTPAAAQASAMSARSLMITGTGSRAISARATSTRTRASVCLRRSWTIVAPPRTAAAARSTSPSRPSRRSSVIAISR